MTETPDVREVINQAILDADVEIANQRRGGRTMVAAQVAELAAERVVAQLAALVPAGIDAGIERLHGAAYRDGLERRGAPSAYREADEAMMQLRALIAAANRPAVTITDEVVLGAVQRINSRGVFNPHVSWVVSPAEMRPVLEWFAALATEERTHE